ncbi:MAG TPA: PqqD family protein [Thermoanaerobaculia bacterium]|nr:PqqD family protein [Thermoanaerobaculia bacterium]
MTYQRSREVVCREVGGESILVPIRNRVGDLESIFVLNPMAARIWSLLDRAISTDEIVDAICTEFEVDRETAAADVNELLASLEVASLVNKEPS